MHNRMKLANNGQAETKERRFERIQMILSDLVSFFKAVISNPTRAELVFCLPSGAGLNNYSLQNNGGEKSD